MRKKITETISEAKGKFNSYTALLSFRYSNLCIDADPRALLSVTIKQDESEKNIEDLAYVANPQKDQFAIYPKEQWDIADIVAAIVLAHPEFKMKIKDWDNYPEDMKEEGEDYKYLLFTMPEVNKDRRDLLTEAVKGLHDQWDAKCEVVRADSTARLAAATIGQEKALIDRVKAQLDDLYTTYHNLGEQETKSKLDEIEEAYQRYLTRQKEKQAQNKAPEGNVGASMRMGGTDE